MPGGAPKRTPIPPKKKFQERKRDAKSSKLAEIQKLNHEAGNVVCKAAADLLAAKEGEMNKANEGVFITADIVETAATARVAAGTYIQNKDPTDWKKLTDALPAFQAL